MLLHIHIKWLYLERAEASCRASKWKIMAPIFDKYSLTPCGKQCIFMEGYHIPLDINNGLTYLRCRQPTLGELTTLPHIIMTADVDWNLSIYDNEIEDIWNNLKCH